MLESVEIEPLVDMVISAHSLPARAKMMHTQVDLNAPSCLAEPMLVMSVLIIFIPMRCTDGTEIRHHLYQKQYGTTGSRVFIDEANTGSPT